jgi:hypothetical protein
MIGRISGRALSSLPGDAFSVASEPLIFGSSDALVAIILRKSSYILLTSQRLASRLRALTDLGEIDKFVKEQAEAIPLGEAAILYRLEKPAATLLTGTQMRSVRYAQLWQRESNGRR